MRAYVPIYKSRTSEIAQFFKLQSVSILAIRSKTHLLFFRFQTKLDHYLKQKQLSVGLIAQLIRGLCRYRRGHGFEPRSSLNFFQVVLLSTAIS